MNTVGRYEIREKIGKGAMATVYLAFDPKIGRTVAIKVLHEDLCSDANLRKRFVADATAAGSLSHPNIVTVFDTGEQDSRPYIAMELVDGRTLSEVVREGTRLPARDVVEIGIQLARALDYAHRNGIVHRDVKPANIMLLRGGVEIKVVDFGICRIEDSNATQKTEAGDVLGTPRYMAPEQLLGKKVDGRADLFSVGVVLYQLLTGTTPFDGDTLAAVAVKIIQTEPEPIDKLRPDLPLRLRRVVERCLRKAPDKRYQSGAELAQDLVLVARELAETAGDKPNARRGLSLGLRNALIMATLILVTMIVTTVFIHQSQAAAMMRQATGYGGSLVKFMASQNAEAVLGEDWPVLEVFIEAAMSRQGFHHLQIVDRKGVIRGSTVASELGTPFAAPTGELVSSQDPTVSVVRRREADGQYTLDFATPIAYQGKELGTVHLGIFETPLTEVSHLTLSMLGVLIAVTCSIAGVASYVLGRRLVMPLRVMRDSLAELGRGRYDYRIRDPRRDEFGELYAAFDATAAALQQRHETASATTQA